MQLTLKIAPRREPLTLEETKTYLRITSDQEDTHVHSLIAASRAYVEGVTGRALLKQGWLLHLTPPYPPSFPLTQTKQGELIFSLPRPPLISIVSVKAREKTIAYGKEEDKIRLSPLYWDCPLAIAFWAGYGETPDSLPPDLKMAVLMGVRYLYEGQEIRLPLLTPYRVFKII